MKTRNNYISLLLLALAVTSKSIAAGWDNFSNITLTTDALVKHNTLWITAKGGIIKVDLTTGQRSFIHKGEAGLLSASVEKIITNALTGDTWIGTYDNGLARWNGTSFESYPFPQNMLLMNMRFDPLGKIWLESDMGLFRFDPATGVYTKLNDTPSNSWTYNAWGYDFLPSHKAVVFNGTTNLILDVPSGAVIDSFQNPIDTSVHVPGELGLNALFLGCSPVAVSTFTLDSVTCLLQLSNAVLIHEKNGVLRNGDAGLQTGEMVVNIVRTENGELILFSDMGNVYKWTGHSWTFLMNVPSSNQASRLLSVYNGTYYFNTGAEVTVLAFTPASSVLIDAREYPFPTNHIRAVAEKPSGEIVVASANTLLKYDDASRNWIPTLTMTSKYNMVSTIKFLNGNMYYIDYGSMMYAYNGVNFIAVPKLPAGVSNDVYAYDVDPDGNIWMVNGDGILKYDGIATTKVLGNVSGRYYTSVKFDEQRRVLWIGTSKGIIQYDVDFATSLLIDHTSVSQMAGGEAIQTITNDKNNNIWFGANNGRTVMFDGNQYTVIGLPNAQNNDFVVDIDFDMDSVYFNMRGGIGGIYKYYNGNFKFLHPTTIPQLVSAQNEDILVDKNGSLWIAHDDAGVSVLRSGKATGIKDNDTYSLSFFPNPARNSVAIKGQYSSNALFSIVDMQGKVIQTGLLTGTIDLSSFEGGLYYISVLDQQKKYFGKLIKQ